MHTLFQKQAEVARAQQEVAFATMGAVHAANRYHLAQLRANPGRGLDAVNNEIATFDELYAYWSRRVEEFGDKWKECLALRNAHPKD